MLSTLYTELGALFGSNIKITYTYGVPISYGNVESESTNAFTQNLRFKTCECIVIFYFS